MRDKSKTADRRRTPRRETNLAGVVKFYGRADIACTIRNLSDGGALIVFAIPQSLPHSFFLTIKGASAPFGCEVRHHYGVSAGVEFVDVARVSIEGTATYGGEVGNWIETEQPPLIG